MNVIGYDKNGMIRAEIDGAEWAVPDDMGNRHRAMIYDQWEMGPPDEAGNRERINTIPVIGEGPPTQDNLIAYAAQSRWEAEVGGTQVAGQIIATDDRSKTLITGAYRRAEKDPEVTLQWKSADGVFTQIDAPTILFIGDAMFQHVQDCFAAEAQAVEAIQAGTVTTREEVDAIISSAIAQQIAARG